MVYAPQRRHAVGSMSTTLQALALMQHLYSPNTIVLICRVVAQINIRAPAAIQPTRSLFALFFLVASTNLAAVLFHLLDFAGGQNGAAGLVLDFVGQTNPASLTRILLIDLGIFILQLVTVVVSYVTNYGPTVPKSELFPYDDLLLAPAAAPRALTEGDLDVESGDQLRQRRYGKGPRYHGVSSDATELWLEEEDEDEGTTGAATRPRVFHAVSTLRGRRAGGVPMIFSLSLSHLVNLIFRLPAPNPPRSFSGGTPLNTPPVTPRAAAQQASLNTLVTALAEAQGRAETTRNTSVQRLAASNAVITGAVDPRPAEEGVAGTTPRNATNTEDERQRIPGDYWTSRA